MGRKDYGDKNTKLRGAGKVAKRQAGFDKTGKLEFIERLGFRDPRTANRSGLRLGKVTIFFQPFKAINKKGGKRVKSAKGKKVDVLTKESKRVFDEPKEEEINEEVQETKKDLFEDGDDDEGKLII